MKGYEVTFGLLNQKRNRTFALLQNKPKMNRIFIQTSTEDQSEVWDKALAVLYVFSDECEVNFYPKATVDGKWIVVDAGFSYPILQVVHHLAGKISVDIKVVCLSECDEGFTYLHFLGGKLIRHLDFGHQGLEEYWNVVQGEIEAWEKAFFFKDEPRPGLFQYMELNDEELLEMEEAYGFGILEQGKTTPVPFEPFWQIPDFLELPTHLNENEIKWEDAVLGCYSAPAPVEKPFNKKPWVWGWVVAISIFILFCFLSFKTMYENLGVPPKDDSPSLEEIMKETKGKVSFGYAFPNGERKVGAKPSEIHPYFRAVYLQENVEHLVLEDSVFISKDRSVEDFRKMYFFSVMGYDKKWDKPVFLRLQAHLRTGTLMVNENKRNSLEIYTCKWAANGCQLKIDSDGNPFGCFPEEEGKPCEMEGFIDGEWR